MMPSSSLNEGQKADVGQTQLGATAAPQVAPSQAVAMPGITKSDQTNNETAPTKPMSLVDPRESSGFNPKTDSLSPMPYKSYGEEPSTWATKPKWQQDPAMGGAVDPGFSRPLMPGIDDSNMAQSPSLGKPGEPMQGATAGGAVDQIAAKQKAMLLMQQMQRDAQAQAAQDLADGKVAMAPSGVPGVIPRGSVVPAMPPRLPPKPAPRISKIDQIKQRIAAAQQQRRFNPKMDSLP